MISSQVWAATAPPPPVSKFDAGGLGRAAEATPTPVPGKNPKLKENRSKSVAQDEAILDAKAERDLLSTISSLTTVLNGTPEGPLRDRVLLNRAVAANRYGRQKVISAKKYALTDEVKRYLNLSIDDADILLKNPKTSRDIVLRAHDIAGTSALYLEKNDLARKHFLDELALNPPGEKAGRLGLMLAEQDFDQGNFQEAVKFYTTYFPRMTSKWKELSLYKLGWCMINLKALDQAKLYFLKIAKANSPTGVGRDAVRDLAYITSSKSGCVPDIIGTQQKIPALDDQLVYLEDVLANLEALNFPAEHTQVADLLLKIEKRPVERIGILLSQIRMQKRAYASVSHLKAFTVTADYIQQLKDSDVKAIMVKHQSALELESENIFKSFIDTYSGRVRSLEAPIQTPEQLISALKYQFQFFKKFFASAQHFPLIVELWENLSIDNKDWAAVDETTEYIISDQPKLAALLENAYLNQIAALDQLKTNLSRRAKRLKEYVEKFPKSQRWPQIAKWYAQIEMDAGHFDVAAKTWDAVMARDPNDDTFYQLQFCRFKLLDYDGVLGDARNKTYLKPKSNMMELYREAALKAAELSKTKDPALYRKRIEEFINLSSDPQKARIARLDYFNFMVSSGQLEEAEQRYAALPAEEKKQASYNNFKQDLWKAALDKGLYDLAVKAAPSRQNQVFSNLLAGHPLDAKDLDTLTAAEKSYFLGLATLFDPDFAIKYLKRGPISAKDRDLLILSYRIKLNQWHLVRTKELEKLLGKNYNFAEAAVEPLAIEKTIESVTFPDLVNLSAAKQSRVVEDNLYLVRKHSKSAMKVIVGKSPEAQLHVFEKMEQLETKMANFLLSSPVPAGLTPEQTAQYQQGLKGAAEEFVQNAGQFKLLANKSRESLDKKKNYLESRILPQPDMKDWPWPSGTANNAKLQPAFKMVKDGNIMGGMALLDYLRPSEIASDENFFFVRAGTILQKQPVDALRIYLLEELERMKQTQVIKAWADLTKRPVPEAL